MAKPTIEVNIRYVNGEPMLDDVGTALLFGIQPEQLAGLVADGPAALPAEWVKQGRRRAREAMSRTGTTAMVDAMAYWAGKDHGAKLVLMALFDSTIAHDTNEYIKQLKMPAHTAALALVSLVDDCVSSSACVFLPGFNNSAVGLSRS